MHRYLSQMQCAAEISNGTRTIRDVLRTLHAGIELIQLLTALNPTMVDRVPGAHIQQILSGKYYGPDERKKTTARDLQFQYFAQATLESCGIHTQSSEPDFLASVGSVCFGVAVKRISSPKKLRSRVRSADHQATRAGCRGFLFADVSRLAVGKTPLVEVDSDEMGMRLLEAQQDRIVADVLAVNVDNVIGCIAYVSVPVIVGRAEPGTLTRFQAAHNDTAQPIERTAFEELVQHLEKLTT
jgi:hypothetical protein